MIVSVPLRGKYRGEVVVGAKGCAALGVFM